MDFIIIYLKNDRFLKIFAVLANLCYTPGNSSHPPAQSHKGLQLHINALSG